MRELQVPDYYKVIKRPMDLRTMLNKLKNRVYDEISEVVADVKLIVANCRRYNEDDSEISQVPPWQDFSAWAMEFPIFQVITLKPLQSVIEWYI